MAEKSHIVDATEKSRNVSDDSSMVTYGLKKNIDFSRPKDVVGALAQVLFSRDAMHWFHFTDESVDFNPTCKVTTVLAKEDHDLMENVANEFLVDLMAAEIGKHLSQQIKDEAD